MLHVLIYFTGSIRMALFVYLVGILLKHFTNAWEQDFLTLDKSVLDPVLEHRVCLQSNVAFDTIVTSPSQCMMFCSLNDACKCFSFTSSTGQCRGCSNFDGDFDYESGALMYTMIGIIIIIIITLFLFISFNTSCWRLTIFFCC